MPQPLYLTPREHPKLTIWQHAAHGLQLLSRPEDAMDYSARHWLWEMYQWSRDTGGSAGRILLPAGKADATAGEGAEHPRLSWSPGPCPDASSGAIAPREIKSGPPSSKRDIAGRLILFEDHSVLICRDVASWDMPGQTGPGIEVFPVVFRLCPCFLAGLDVSSRFVRDGTAMRLKFSGQHADAVTEQLAAEIRSWAGHFSELPPIKRDGNWPAVFPRAVDDTDRLPAFEEDLASILRALMASAPQTVISVMVTILAAKPLQGSSEPMRFFFNWQRGPECPADLDTAALERFVQSRLFDGDLGWKRCDFPGLATFPMVDRTDTAAPRKLTESFEVFPGNAHESISVLRRFPPTPALQRALRKVPT